MAVAADRPDGSISVVSLMSLDSLRIRKLSKGFIRGERLIFFSMQEMPPRLETRPCVKMLSGM